MVANKLQVHDIPKWINHELSGYGAKLYDRTQERLTQDEVERIRL